MGDERDVTAEAYEWLAGNWQQALGLAVAVLGDEEQATDALAEAASLFFEQATALDSPFWPAQYLRIVRSVLVAAEYRKLAQPLLKFARSLDGQQADDAVSFAFEKLLEGRCKHLTYDGIKGWLFIVVKNFIRSGWRYTNRQESLDEGWDSPDDDTWFRHEVVSDSNPEDRVEWIDLSDSLEKLSTREREALARRVAGWSLEEIAGAMGNLSKETVKEYLSRARQKLRSSGIRRAALSSGFPEESNDLSDVPRSPTHTSELAS